MSEFSSEKTEMSAVEFASRAMKRVIAPAGSAQSVKERVQLAARRLGWPISRTKDIWYADPRTRLDADELRHVEQLTGLKYGTDEVAALEDLVARADALLASQGKNCGRPLSGALWGLLGSLARA